MIPSWSALTRAVPVLRRKLNYQHPPPTIIIYRSTYDGVWGRGTSFPVHARLAKTKAVKTLLRDDTGVLGPHFQPLPAQTEADGCRALTSRVDVLLTCTQLRRMLYYGESSLLNKTIFFFLCVLIQSWSRLRPTYIHTYKQNKQTIVQQLDTKNKRNNRRKSLLSILQDGRHATHFDRATA